MSKQEFVETLRLALSGKMSAEQVAENVNYYEDYINTQIRMGNAEEDVLDKLGDPRLIAKSILSANKAGANDYESDASTQYGNGYYENSGERSTFGDRMSNFGGRMPGWLLALIVVVAIIAVLGVVFSVLSFLAPILVPMLVVLFLVKLFRDWLN